MDKYFILDNEIAIYIRHLKTFVEKLVKRGAVILQQSALVNRYLDLIYHHMCFGYSTERSDLTKGIGLMLRSCGTVDLLIIQSCMDSCGQLWGSMLEELCLYNSVAAGYLLGKCREYGRAGRPI